MKEGKREAEKRESQSQSLKKEEEYDENFMMIASMARCLITTLVRQTPRSLLDPGKLERDEKEWIFVDLWKVSLSGIFGKYLFRINFLLI